ncbi:TPA: zinc-finger-containing protein, partial [Serratia marcescens]
CDYCGKPAALVRGFVIYPHRKDLANGYYWSCDPCGAYVGCHRDSNAMPLGRLANAQLRAAKRLAHAAFDPLWKEFGMKRADAYQWLAEQLGIPGAECHIGMFDVDMCRRVQRVATEYKNSL